MVGRLAGGAARRCGVGVLAQAATSRTQDSALKTRNMQATVDLLH